MSVLLLTIVFSVLWKAELDCNKNSFMSMEDTKFLRGFWCLIVVLVHVPSMYQNTIQDMLGSFAYIGVTFFFMTSSYGLKYSIKKKPDYMRNFWKRRIPAILIPALIANAIGVLIGALEGNKISLLSFLNINNWVKVLLLYYFSFWIIYHVLIKFVKKRGIWQDVLMCAIVIIFSLVDRLTVFKITSIWIVEPLGFAYGIIASNHEEQIIEWFEKNWGIKSIVLMVLSGVLGVAYLKLKPIAFWGDYCLKIVLGMAITSFIFIVLSKIRAGNSINGFLGNISYEVYLMHGTAFRLIAMLGKINSGVYICSAIFLTIVLSFLLNKMCRRILRR